VARSIEIVNALGVWFRAVYGVKGGRVMHCDGLLFPALFVSNLIRPQIQSQEEK
jgi:hypothetical protein